MGFPCFRDRYPLLVSGTVPALVCCYCGKGKMSRRTGRRRRRRRRRRRSSIRGRMSSCALLECWTTTDLVCLVGQFRWFVDGFIQEVLGLKLHSAMGCQAEESKRVTASKSSCTTVRGRCSLVSLLSDTRYNRGLLYNVI